MNIRRLIQIGFAACLVALSACTPTGGGGGNPTTTTGPTGRIIGVTANQVCAGPVSPTSCTTPFIVTSDHVQISIGTVLFLATQSGTDGLFSVDLPAGSYNFDAKPITAGGTTYCPVKAVNVVAGATATLSLHCTVILP